MPTPDPGPPFPLLLQGRDVLGIAQTGTGKTAAFALPILQRLAAPRHAPGPRACAPWCWRRPASSPSQIAEQLRHLRRDLGLRHAVVFGGVGTARQVEALARGVDILVATPGRLLDLMEQRQRQARQRRRSSSSTRPTACSTWASSTTSAASSSVAAASSARRCSSRPPCRATIAELGARDPERTRRGRGRAAGAAPSRRSTSASTSSNAATKRALLSHLLADPALERRHRLHPHQARRRPRRRGSWKIAASPSEAIHGNKSPERPPAGARRLPPRQDPRAGRHRHRRARHRRRRRHPRHQLRPARRPRELRPPHRPHRARRRRGHRDLVLRPRASAASCKSIERLTNQRIAVHPHAGQRGHAGRSAKASARGARGARQRASEQPHAGGGGRSVPAAVAAVPVAAVAAIIARSASVGRGGAGAVGAGRAPVAARRLSRGQPQGDRPQGDRPQGGPPRGEASGYGARPKANRPYTPRPQGDRAVRRSARGNGGRRFGGGRRRRRRSRPRGLTAAAPAREFLPRGRSPDTCEERAHIGRALLRWTRRSIRRSRAWS